MTSVALIASLLCFSLLLTLAVRLDRYVHDDDEREPQGWIWEVSGRRCRSYEEAEDTCDLAENRGETVVVTYRG